MPHATVHGQVLFYFERPAPASTIPPLLLIHGAGGTSLDWPPHLRRLPGVTVYALDLPGHGQSGLQGRDTITAYTADVRGLLDVLKLDKTILIGHSMGAAIALQCTLDAPERVAGLVVVSGGARMRVNPALLDAALNDTSQVVEFVMAYGYGPHTDRTLKQFGEKGLRATAPEVLHGDYVACNGFDVRGRLGEIATPVLIVGGGADQMMPVKLSAELAAGLLDADLRRIEEAGHMLPVEFPERLAEIVSGWLQERWRP